jgi:hypothetical protein
VGLSQILNHLFRPFMSLIELQLLAVELPGELGELSVYPFILRLFLNQLLQLLRICDLQLLDFEFQVLLYFFLVLQDSLVLLGPVLRRLPAHQHAVKLGRSWGLHLVLCVGQTEGLFASLFRL